LAEAAIGRGRMAWDSFARISPWTKNAIQSIHGAEPYVVNQMIAMPPNLEAGRAKNPWLTGTASWLYVAMAEGILGVKPDVAGLRIDPCVPGWKRFRVSRMFRGVRYEIDVTNPDGVERGVESLVVDGERIAGNLIPLPPRDAKVVRVEASMSRQCT
jgi:cellobiose phosphorylase